MALVLSTTKSGERRNKQVYAVGDGLSDVGVSAELLAEADQDERLNQRVDAAFHRVALLGRKNP